MRRPQSCGTWQSELNLLFVVDGLRIDSVANINPGFFPGMVEAAGVFCMGEVLDGDSRSACGYQDVLDGFTNYPM